MPDTVTLMGCSGNAIEVGKSTNRAFGEFLTAI
jgi:hypothetical protein